MFAIEVQSSFSSAHALRIPHAGGGGVIHEPLHGHDFRVTVLLTAHALDSAETVIDFHLLEELLAQIIGPWRNRNLNEIYPFTTRINPSAERVAEQIGLQLQALLQERFAPDIASRALRLAEVRLTEAPGCLAIWRP
jgi:6-pyruvoyltetrahydropterin/6-carboxytetrahydropterin synthase